MEINDITGIGKVLPIDKLVTVVSSACGRVTKSFFDKKDANSKAYEMKKLAEAEAYKIEIVERAKTKASIEADEERSKFLERTQERLLYQEAKKQLNVESITAFAAEELKDEQPVTDEKIDEDWTTRFFRYAEDISSEEIQALWGKILAGEIKQPKSYSLRTLELIRNLSKNEAELFLKVAKLSIKSGNTFFIFKGSDKELSEKFGIEFSDITQLVEVGIIQPGDMINWNLFQNPVPTQSVFLSGNYIVFVKKKENTETIAIPIYLFTKSGSELLNLVKTLPPFEYLKSFANSIKRENVVVEYANILEVTPTHVRHTQPLIQF